MTYLVLITIGLLTGLLSGVFGIGGGILIVPALVFGLGFSQKLATGTSLAILLPPVGIAAVWQYYKSGNVDIKAALLIAAMMMFGAWLGANIAISMDSKHIKTLFGILLILIGGVFIFDGLYRHA